MFYFHFPGGMIFATCALPLSHDQSIENANACPLPLPPCYTQIPFSAVASNLQEQAQLLCSLSNMIGWLVVGG